MCEDEELHELEVARYSKNNCAKCEIIELRS